MGLQNQISNIESQQQQQNLGGNQKFEKIKLSDQINIQNQKDSGTVSIPQYGNNKFKILTR
jgi:hypothetical protein